MSQAVTLRQWTDVVRRARLGRTVKAVAMVLATYADSDGTRVFPGVARLAYDCEINYNTAQQALAKLREVQLVELVRPSARKGAKRRDADEYRLILGPELLDHIEVPTPAAAEVAMEAIRRAKQGRHKTGPHPAPMGAVESGTHPAPMGAVDDSEARPHPSARGADEPTAPIGATSNDATAPSGACRPHPAPLGPTVHDRDTTTTAHSDEEVVTTSHGPRARAAEAEPESAADVIDLEARRAAVAALAPSRCGHGLQGGNRADGQPNCPICRRLAPIAESLIPTPRGAPA